MPKGVDVAPARTSSARSAAASTPCTGERVDRRRALVEQAAAAGPRCVAAASPPLMHGAAQWGDARRAASSGNTRRARRAEVRRRRGVARRSSASGSTSLMITGDAMARPLIEALEARRPSATTSRRCSSISVDGGAIFSPSVKDQFLELLPEPRCITDAIGVVRDRRQRHAHGRARATRRRPAAAPRSTPARDTVVLDDDLQAARRRAPARSAGSPAAATSRSATTRTRRRRRRRSSTVDGMRYVDPRRLRHGRGRRHDHAARPRLGVHQHRRREGLPRGGRGALKAHPEVFDAVVVGVPDERWGERVAAVVQPRDGRRADARRARRRTAATTIAGYKVPRKLVIVDAIVRSPAASPTTPGPPAPPAPPSASPTDPAASPFSGAMWLPEQPIRSRDRWIWAAIRPLRGPICCPELPGACGRLGGWSRC